MSVVLRAARRRVALDGAHARTATFTAAVLGPAALGAALTDAAPTGIPLPDKLWAAGLVAAVAYLAGTARRWTWFPAAGAAAALAGEHWATAMAAVAVAIGIWSAVTDTRTRARGALVGGLGTAALLGAGATGFHGLTAVITALAVAPVAISGYRHAGRRIRARVRKVAGGLGVAAAIAVGGAVLGIISVQGDLLDGARMVDEGLAAARDADDDLAGERLSRGSRHLSQVEATLSGWFVGPARLLPVVSQNITAVDTLADKASEAAEVASTAADAADVDSLRFIGGRLDPEAVAAMEEPLLDSIEAVEALSDELDDTNRSPWLVSPLVDRLDIFDGQVGEALPDGQSAITAIRNAPRLLGVEQPARYLVLFVTPVEARGRTGFPGNFAELVVDDGQLSMPRFGRISELEQGGVPPEARAIDAPVLAEYMSRYGRFDPETTWRNITMSPDFATVAAVAHELYPQSGGAPIDGVLSIDPEGLAALLRYTDPVQVEGLPMALDADNAADFLQLDQYLEYSDVSRRIDILEQVARTTFERLTTADLPGPRDVAETFDPLVDGGHVQFTTFHLPTVTWLDSFGLTGRLGPVRGDSLAVTTSNAGGSKIDLFLQRQLRYDVAWDPATGQVEGTITLALTNQAPASGLPDYVIGNTVGLPTGTNRSYLSVYTPHQLVAARIDGQPASLGAGEELGRRVYSTFVDMAPGQTVLVELEVRGTAAPAFYVLDLYQQPLVLPEQAVVNVDVAGDLPVATRLEPEDNGTIEEEDRRVTWTGPLDRRTSLFVAATDDPIPDDATLAAG